MNTKELIIYFMGTNLEEIQKSQEVKDNLHLYKLSREYLELLDYIFEEKYHEVGPEDLLSKTAHKKQIEFYIKMTYELDISEIGKKCRDQNMHVGFMTNENDRKNR